MRVITGGVTARLRATGNLRGGLWLNNPFCECFTRCGAPFFATSPHVDAQGNGVDSMPLIRLQASAAHAECDRPKRRNCSRIQHAIEETNAAGIKNTGGRGRWNGGRIFANGSAGKSARTFLPPKSAARQVRATIRQCDDCHLIGATPTVSGGAIKTGAEPNPQQGYPCIISHGP
jgi:hypothetical protein